MQICSNTLGSQISSYLSTQMVAPSFMDDEPRTSSSNYYTDVSGEQMKQSNNRYVSRQTLNGYKDEGNYYVKDSWSASSVYKQSKKNDYFSGNAFSKMLANMEDSKFFNHKLLRHSRKEVMGWFCMILLVIVGYKFFSDGSFSAILTLASAFQCFSLALLNLKIISQRSMSGISRRSVALIVVCLVFRLFSTLFYNGYLPVDRSGDWIYQGADLMSLVLALNLLFYSRYYYDSSIQMQQDKDTCHVLIPMGIAFVLALVIHPTLNQNLLADTAWTFALYLETYSMVPQLFMMVKVGGEVETLTSHYVASMAGSKFSSILFWYFSFKELAPRHGGRNIAGWAVILSYSIQTLLFADFFYYYVKSLRKGKTMIIHF